jgi:hypothetical protein
VRYRPAVTRNEGVDLARSYVQGLSIGVAEIVFFIAKSLSRLLYIFEIHDRNVSEHGAIMQRVHTNKMSKQEFS